MDQNTNVPKETGDPAFNVMPQDSRGYTGSIPTPSAPMEHASSSHRWVYLLIGAIVLLALGGVAYYMLGFNKTEETPQVVASRLPKVWLQQYFNVDSCSDMATCGEAADPENDGLGNYDEFKAGTNPLNPDTDTDGLADGDEMNIYKTDPTLKYTDRREIVAQNNWTDGFQIKNGFDPLTPALKFNDIRKQQIESAIQQYQLHEPSITTLSPTSTSSQ